MFGCVDSCVLAGLDVRRVRVEADISRGSQVEFSLVGLASTTVKEARARVRSAVRNSGLEFPTTRLTVNLAPAELRKEGTALDLPIAIAMVRACAKRPAPARSAFLGELALDGSVRHVDGVLVAARGLRELGYETIFVPANDAIEATLAGDLEVIPCESLIAVVKHLLESEPIPVAAPHCGGGASECPIDHDLVEVHGQEEAKRALEVAAAGGHHLLLSGPPVAGKTMLARCLPGVLPPLELWEALEVAQLRSLLGELPHDRPLDWTRPFRAPHHSVSAAGLIGGGGGLAPTGESSSSVRERVVMARRRQLDRQGALNAQLKPARLRQLAGLSPPSRRTLERWSAQRGMTARGFHRVWRVARTAADLDGSEEIAEHHVLEALGFRLQDVAS